MLNKVTCPFCQGSGLVTVEKASFLGLIKKQIPARCNNCNGIGYNYETPACTFCDGRGLVGNESEICRACNGQGRVDTFSFIPRDMLKPGTRFERRCDQCGATEFEITSDIEEYKLTKSWEREEELRQVEMVERVKVRCVACGHRYNIPMDGRWNQDLTPEDIGILEDAGFNLKYLYKGGVKKPG